MKFAQIKPEPTAPFLQREDIIKELSSAGPDYKFNFNTEKIKQVHDSEKKTNPIKFGYFNKNNNDREAAATLMNLNGYEIQNKF
jgi:hypothetical protein